MFRERSDCPWGTGGKPLTIKAAVCRSRRTCLKRKEPLTGLFELRTLRVISSQRVSGVPHRASVPNRCSGKTRTKRQSGVHFSFQDIAAISKWVGMTRRRGICFGDSTKLSWLDCLLMHSALTRRASLARHRAMNRRCIRPRLRQARWDTGSGPWGLIAKLVRRGTLC